MILIFIIVALIAMIITATVRFNTDYNKIKNGEKPIYSEVHYYLDGGTAVYDGFGYKIIKFNRLNGYKELKAGFWFMKYDDFKEEYEKYDADTILNDNTNFPKLTVTNSNNTYTIENEDSKKILDFLTSLQYNIEQSDNSPDYTIKTESGELYLLNTYLNCVLHNGMQAYILESDVEMILDSL
jgi:hypothetical protein